MSILVTLPSWALTTVAAARQYTRAETADDDDTIALLVRSVSARIEQYTRRKLKSRAYAAGTPDTRFILSGRGENVISLPEWPVTTFSNAWFVDASPTSLVLTALTTTSAYVALGGKVVLPNDVFPEGKDNIRVAATCGYLSGTHDAELYILEHAALRLIQSMWQDFRNQTGRTLSVAEGRATVTFSETDMPGDVVNMLQPFVRSV